MIGSFVNVLVLRHGERDILGRSACPRCGTTLQWFELVPVLSWLLLRGRCRTCKAGISIQYPLVEMLTSAGFLAIGLAPLPLFAQVIGAVIIALLVAIAVYDLYHTIIPDIWVWPFVGLSLVYAFASPLMLARPVGSLLSFGDTWHLILLSGPLVASPLLLLWLVSGGKWMGFGDVKFALGMGFLLGIVPGFIALLLAFVLGAFVGVFILLPLPHIMRFLQRAGPVRGLASNGAGITRSPKGVPGYTMKSEVPFGPFLITALCIVWFSNLYHFDITGFLMSILTYG